MFIFPYVLCFYGCCHPCLLKILEKFSYRTKLDQPFTIKMIIYLFELILKRPYIRFKPFSVKASGLPHWLYAINAKFWILTVHFHVKYLYFIHKKYLLLTKHVHKIMCNVFIKQSQQSISVSSVIFLIHLLSKVHILYVEPTLDQKNNQHSFL